MAKGKLGAYTVRPQAPSPQFEGADAFARMAGRLAAERAEERAEQRQLAAEMRQSIANAVEAGNVDYSQINSSVHSIVGKVIDHYGNQIVDAMQDLESGYSFEKQMELNRKRVEFQSNIGKIVGLGDQIKNVSDPKWDPILSAPAINGNWQFITSLPEMLESFDPATMQVGGKDIVSIYNDLVDSTQLIEHVDANLVLAKMQSILQQNPEQVSRFSGGREISFNRFTYDPQEVSTLFNDMFEGTNEQKKLKMIIASEYASLSEEEQENYPYITYSDEGAYVSSLNTLDYFKDKYLPDEVKVGDKEQKPTTPSSAETKTRLENEIKEVRLKRVDDAFTGDGSLIVGQPITLGDRKGEVMSARASVNPITGESGAWIDYRYKASDGMYLNGVEFYSNDLAGRQKLANNLFSGDLDYEMDSYVLGHMMTVENLPLGGRAVEIESFVNSMVDSLDDAYRIGKAEGGSDKAMELIKETLGAYGVLAPEYDNLLDVLSARKPGRLGGTKIRLGGKNVFHPKEIGKSEENRRKSLEAIARGAVMAESEGVKNVEKTINNFLKEGSVDPFNFEIDNIQRHINNRYKEGNREIARKLVDEFLSDMSKAGRLVKDDETIAFLNSNLTSEEALRKMAVNLIGEKQVRENEEAYKDKNAKDLYINIIKLSK